MQSTTYPTVGYLNIQSTGEEIPILDIPLMSDYEWQQKCLQDRRNHPEKYTDIEDVNATITRIENWLAEHEKSIKEEIA